MSILRCITLLDCMSFALIVVGAATPTGAQMPIAKLDWIFPPGGRAGSEVEVTIAGTDIDHADRIVFSHPGLQATPKMAPAPATNVAPDAVPNQFVVSIAGDVPEGVHEARVISPFGLSTSRFFVVSRLSEANEPDANHSIENATPIDLPITVNGRADGVAPDFYRVSCDAGRTVLIDVWAERIDSRMDPTLEILDAAGRRVAVCRDYHGLDPFIAFTPTTTGDYWIKVNDATYRGDPSYFYRLSVHRRPYIEFVFPPVATPGAQTALSAFGWNLPGTTDASLTSPGRAALSRREIEIDAPPLGDQGEPSTLATGAQSLAASANRFSFVAELEREQTNRFVVNLSAGEHIVENEPNNSENEPNKLDAPCDIWGQFFPRRDEDWFEFRAATGDVFQIEVTSHGLGLAVDPSIVVRHTPAEGSAAADDLFIGEADDRPALSGGRGFDRIPLDPSYTFTAPIDGAYHVRVVNMQDGPADPRSIYRLKIFRPAPDFDATIATQSPWNPAPEQPVRWNSPLRRNGTASFTVWVDRKNGFAGDVEVMARDLPNGVTCEPARIPPDKNSGTIVLLAANDAAAESQAIRFEATGMHGETTITRAARVAALVWDTAAPNAQTSVRLEDDIQISVAPESSPLSILFDDGPAYEIARGGVLTIPFRVEKHAEVKELATWNPLDLPKEITSEIHIAEGGDKGEWRLTMDPNCPIGRRSLAFDGKPTIVYRRLENVAQQAESRRAEIAARLAELQAATDPAADSAEQTAKLESALAAATETAKQLADAAKPTDRLAYIISPSITVHVVESPADSSVDAAKVTGASTK